MIKFRTLKNSYANFEKKFTHIITEEEALNNIWQNLLMKLRAYPKKREYIIHMKSFGKWWRRGK